MTTLFWPWITKRKGSLEKERICCFFQLPGISASVFESSQLL